MGGGWGGGKRRKRKRDALVRLCPPFLFFSPAAQRKVWSPVLRSSRFLSFTMQAKRSNKRTSVSKKIGRSGEGLSIRSQFRSLSGFFWKHLLCRRWSSSYEDWKKSLYLLGNKMTFVWLFLFAEIPLPNEQARMDILKIHSAKITKHGDIGEWWTSSGNTKIKS